MPKTIAIYLPQFHQVEENNRWWGQGFTDWVTVKNARPLFDGHRQPRVPADRNYYDLLQHDTMKRQAEMAAQYKVSGFCFYHYWFKDGRRILEKPAENLLKWTDINMPFCFSWANQTWARTWTNIPNSNAWVGADFENKDSNDSILLRQSYGGKKDWKEHFEYLLPFFKDSRYIYHDGKPLFLIYKPEYMFCLDNMMEYWKELAVENGLKGICVVTVRNNCRNWSQADYWLMQEFDYTFMSGERVRQNGVWTMHYEDTWEDALKRAYAQSDDKTFFGGFVDCDDTPRRGHRGVAITDASPGIFEKYYRKIAELASAKKSEFIFVNAWNEWGEGAYLEPDEDFGYGYLEAIQRVMEDMEQIDITRFRQEEKYQILECADSKGELISKEKYDKMRKYYRLLNKWVTNMENNRRIATVLEDLAIQNVAVYGMGDLGKHLINELKDSSICVKLCFDKTAEFLQGETKSSKEAELTGIDAIIVTPFMEYKEIRLLLKNIFDGMIISIEELVSECEIL